MIDALFIRSLILWVVFVPIAILNGIFREATYKHVVGDFYSHQISTVSAIIAFLVVAYFLLSKSVMRASTQELLAIGMLLVVLTVAFEFIFGHYVDHASWEKLLADYNIFKGHIWGVFLVVEFLTPLIVKLIKR